jgi:hypothetical protein
MGKGEDTHEKRTMRSEAGSRGGGAQDDTSWWERCGADGSSPGEAYKGAGANHG